MSLGVPSSSTNTRPSRFKAFKAFSLLSYLQGCCIGISVCGTRTSNPSILAKWLAFTYGNIFDKRIIIDNLNIIKEIVWYCDWNPSIFITCPINLPRCFESAPVNDVTLCQFGMNIYHQLVHNFHHLHQKYLQLVISLAR